MNDSSVVIPARLTAVGETVLGIVLAAVPVAVWVAWSPLVLLIVLAAGCVCAALLVALSRLADAERARSGEPMAFVSDQFVEEVHRLFPLTYHHSRKEKPRFRRAMDKLRRMAR